MNETLTVRDFGPIKAAEVTFKRVTVFIGPTGGGKSTLAKLAAICHNGPMFEGGKVVGAKEQLATFSIASFYNDSSSVSWLNPKLDGQVMTLNLLDGQNEQQDQEPVWKAVEQLLAINGETPDGVIDQYLAENPQIEAKDDLKGTLRDALYATLGRVLVDKSRELFKHTQRIAYAPAERVFYASINSSLAGLMRDDIGLPKPLLDFVNSLWQARKEITDLDLPLFNAKYEYRNEQDYIRLPDREEALRLSEAASGIQSVAPLLVLLEKLSRETERPQSFIIEEPELNLFPEAQQELLNVLVAKCAKADSQNDLIITTHSPYLLSHLNLLTYAPQVAKNQPERADEIKALVPEATWIQPGDLAVYYVDGPKGAGGVYSLLNPETGLISDNALDGTAGRQADAFDRLLEINSGF